MKSEINNKKIAVIGGSGRSGSYLVKQLIEQGYMPKLLVRNPDKLIFSEEPIEIIKGDARDLEAIRLLLHGCSVVLSTLGNRKGENSSFSDSTSHILATMKEFGVERFILLSGIGVDLPGDKKTAGQKFQSWLLRKIFPDVMADKQKGADILLKSDANWTLIRLPMIHYASSFGKLNINLEFCPGKKISSTDMANFMIEQITDKRYLKKGPFIAN